MKGWIRRRYGVKLMRWLWGSASAHNREWPITEYTFSGKWKEGT